MHRSGLHVSLVCATVLTPRKVDRIRVAREALLAASNEHALLDTAGIIAFFATITTVVDFAGHYSTQLLKMLDKIALGSN